METLQQCNSVDCLFIFHKIETPKKHQRWKKTECSIKFNIFHVLQKLFAILRIQWRLIFVNVIRCSRLGIAGRISTLAAALAYKIWTNVSPKYLLPNVDLLVASSTFLKQYLPRTLLKWDSLKHPSLKHLFFKTRKTRHTEKRYQHITIIEGINIILVK